MSNIEAVAKALAEVLGASTTDRAMVTVALSGVEYLDSGAINTLFGRVGRIRVVANPILMPVLTVSRLADVAPTTRARRRRCRARIVSWETTSRVRAAVPARHAG